MTWAGYWTAPHLLLKLFELARYIVREYERELLSIVVSHLALAGISEDENMRKDAELDSHSQLIYK